MSDKMRIEGLSYPDISNDEVKRKSGRTTPIRLRHLTWLVILTGLGIGAVLYGTPHLRYIYIYTNTYGQPYYLSCDYIGWHTQRVVPRDGRCPIIQLLKSQQGSH